ncbi:MAG: hypothetical protein HY281_09825 [Nitrospirae bacterium]|nr:hypothetical protein [Nitrospirota bacterium]
MFLFKFQFMAFVKLAALCAATALFGLWLSTSKHKPTSCAKQALGTKIIACGRTHHQPREGIMEIAIIPGLFVAIFAAGAALILWFPYDAPKDRR